MDKTFALKILLVVSLVGVVFSGVLSYRELFGLTARWSWRIKRSHPIFFSALRKRYFEIFQIPDFHTKKPHRQGTVLSGWFRGLIREIGRGEAIDR